MIKFYKHLFSNTFYVWKVVLIIFKVIRLRRYQKYISLYKFLNKFGTLKGKYKHLPSGINKKSFVNEIIIYD